MRVLAVTSLYPRPGRETLAVFNRCQFRALVAHCRCELAVIAPVLWTEELRSRREEWPRRRWYRNADGVWVAHPRYMYTPKFLRHRYGHFYRSSIRATFEEALERFRPQVVLGCFVHPDGWAAVKLAREAGLPAVVKSHGSSVLLGVQDPWRRERIIEALQEANAVVAVSRHLVERVIRLGIDPRKVHLVYNGLDLRAFAPGSRAEARAALGLPPDVPILLFVGNILRAKGTWELVEACRLLAERGLAFRCYLVGSGRDERALRRQIARAGLGERMALVGSVPHAALAAWYRACDLAVLPSHSEGMPNVLREALACGRPFVATRVGGIPEIADPAVSRLVPVGAADALAEGIAELLAARPAPATVLAWSQRINTSWESSAHQLARRLRAVAGLATQPSGSDSSTELPVFCG